jgi:hypothetical protein
MKNTERLSYFKAALATLNISFEKDETYISILAMVDLVDIKEGKTTIDDILKENQLYQKNYDFKQIIVDRIAELNKPDEIS